MENVLCIMQKSYESYDHCEVIMYTWAMYYVECSLLLLYSDNRAINIRGACVHM